MRVHTKTQTCAYTQTHKHTNTQTHKPTNPQTHKHTNTKNTHTQKHTNTQTFPIDIMKNTYCLFQIKFITEYTNVQHIIITQI